jgi:hypothetical protein
MCSGPTTKLGWRFAFFWFDSAPASLAIRLGMDFGYGGAVYLDGVLVH